MVEKWNILDVEKLRHTHIYKKWKPTKKIRPSSHCPTARTPGPAWSTVGSPTAKIKTFSFFLNSQNKKKLLNSPKQRRFGDRKDKKNCAGQPIGASRSARCGASAASRSVARHTLSPHFSSHRPLPYIWIISAFQCGFFWSLTASCASSNDFTHNSFPSSWERQEAYFLIF